MVDSEGEINVQEKQIRSDRSADAFLNTRLASNIGTNRTNAECSLYRSISTPSLFVPLEQSVPAIPGTQHSALFASFHSSPTHHHSLKPSPFVMADLEEITENP